MPEYLSPGVYVEEIDVGIRPIEGVSTSTGGMVGVTERGPVNVPLLVTSFAQYQRWFGGYLDFDDYADAAFLPHAVEGFFQNGGRRLYVSRVVADQPGNVATPAEVMLFDQGEASPFEDSRLLRPAREGDTLLLVEDPLGLADGESLRVGGGSRVEYGEIDDPGGAGIAAGAHLLALRVPLYRAYAAGAAVEELPMAPPAAVADQYAGALAGDHGAGRTTLDLDSINANVVAGSILRIGAGAARELVEVASVPALPAGARVTLAYPLAREHLDGEAVVLVEEGAPAGGATTLAGDSLGGDGLLLVAATAGFASGDTVRVVDAADPNRFEYHVLATFSAASLWSLRFGAYGDHPSGTPVTAVTLTAPAAVDPHATTLAAAAEAGDRTVLVADTGPLVEGDLVRVGDPGPTAELHAVAAVDAAGGTVTLVRPLALDRPQDDPLVKLDRVDGASTHLVQDVSDGETTVFLAAGGADFAVDAIVEIGEADDAMVEYQVLRAPSLGIVRLDAPLEEDHRRGSLVGRRDAELRVQALDVGEWGDELRVTALEDSLTTVTVTEARAPGQPIPLASMNGVEVGTVLDFQGHGLAKVTAVAAGEITIAPLGPAFAVAQNDRASSVEFQLRIEWVKDGRVLGDRTEVLRHLSMDHRHSRYVETVAGRIGGPLRAWDRRPEGSSDFIRVDDQATEADSEALIRRGPDLLFDVAPNGRARAAGRFLDGGGNPPAGIVVETYVGEDDVDPDLRTGLQALRNENRISMVAVPGRTEPEVQQALIDHCELERYRFAILDSLPGADRVRGAAINVVQDQRNLYDTRYAALYYPWLVVRDPFPDDPLAVGDLQLPPSGHVMGIYARTDIERGVHKAPANVVIRGVRDLQRKLNKAEHDVLNPSPTNVCVLRDFRQEGRGLRVWGARCITSDTDWKYVNVRRLFIFLEQSLDEGTQWVVFEPNDAPLWARVRQSIAAFLTRVWRDGALQGATPEEAFFVKCDRTTMTQDDIDNGRLIVLVGVAPVKPAEFVIIRIFQATQEALSQ